MRLRYASITLLVVLVAGCWRTGITKQQAIDSAKSHMEGEAIVLSVVDGPIGELAPTGLKVDDPSMRVWAVTLRGTFITDCKVEALGVVKCPPEPKLGLILLDYADGGFVASSVITVLP